MTADPHLLIDLKTGRKRPSLPRPPLWTSGTSPWPGLVLDQHEEGEAENLNVAPAMHVVVLQLTPSAEVEWTHSTHGRLQRAIILPGQISIFPALLPLSGRTGNTGEFLRASIDPQYYDLAVAGLGAGGPRALVPRRAIEDEFIRAVLIALKNEREAGHPGRQAYGEALVTALCLHLANYHSEPTSSEGPQEEGLPRYQLRKVLELIETRLGEELSLQDLAAIAGLSPFHFSRLFKKSTGVSPYQFVLKTRVHRARELLLSTDISLSELAEKVGFCDQSHLAACFKRICGISPKKFIRQHRR